MKKTLSYKSKRNIIIASVIVILLAIISTTGFLYIKNNDKEAKAFTQENTINGDQITNDTNQIEQGENTTNNQNVENQIQNNENNQNNQNENQATSLNEQTNANNQKGQEQTNANQNNQTSQQTNQNQSTTNNNGTLNQTTGELPEQEFITEEIVEQDVLISEDFMVEWVPANIQANVTTENLEIIRPIFVAIKKANKTVVEKDGTITYTISVLNIGNIEGTATIKDSIDTKTEFIADSIKINDDKTEYTQKDLENGNIKVNIPVKGLVKLSFKVKAIKQLESDEKIENMAYVNDKPTNKVVVDMPNIKVEKTVFMKNNEVIPEEQLNTVTFEEGDIAGYKIKVTNTGTIKLNNVTLKDVLEDNKQIFLDVNKPEEKTNTVVGYDEELSLEPNESSEDYFVYYKVEKNDVKNVSKKDSLKNNVTATGYYTNDNNEEKSVDDNDDAVIKFTAKPDISIVKTQKVGTEKLDEKGCINGNQKELKPGDVIDYKITIKNEGNTELTGVVVTDIMSNNPTGEARKVTINTVKVEDKTRNYTLNNDGSLSIDGVLEVGETLVITASYTVVESDMSAEKVETIKNTATVVTNETNPKDSSVETKTLIYKPIITISKTGKLADGTDANEKTLKYGDTITYILTAKNTGTKYDTVTIKDEDIKTLVDAGYVQITSNIDVAHFNTDGSKKTETITKNKINALSKDGIQVYVPAGKSATVTFTVKVTAAPGTTIKNTVGNDTVTNYVEKQVTAVSSSQKDKNIVIVLDLSDTMLYTETQNDMATVYEGYDADPVGFINKLNAKTDTKLAKAKAAVTQLVNDVLTKNPNNTITIRTFNYSSYNEALKCCEGITTYTKAITECSDEYKQFIGINKEITQSGDKDTINKLINSIKVTHLANTNVVAVMEETEKVVKELAKDKTRDIEVIFIGDGKPTFSTEGCAKGSYYDKDTTLSKIETSARNIRNKAKFYTISYGKMKDSEQTIADKVFSSMATGSTYMYKGDTDIARMLKQIGNSITSTPTKSNNTTNKNNGEVQFELGSKQILNISENTPVTLTITPEVGTALTCKSTNIGEIKNGIYIENKKIIKYNETTKTFTIYANNIDASASISLRYYYSTSN